MASTPQSQLTEHPLPFSGYKTLGADSRPILAAAANNDYLAIPPPPAGVARFIGAVETPVTGILTSGGPLVAGDIQLIYKDENGDEVILAQNSGGEIVGSLFFLNGPPSLIAETDQGVFLRMGPGAGTGDFYASHLDVRNLTRHSVDVTAIFPNTQPLLTVDEDGVVLFTPFVTVGGYSAGLYNFDVAPHTVRIFFTDGVNSGEVPAASGPVAAGAVSTFPLTYLKKGQSLSVCLDLGNPAPVKPARLIACLQQTNLSPVRPDQGGAF